MLKMKKLIKYTFKLSYIAWSSLFLYSIAMLIGYNTFLEVFDYECIYAETFEILDSKNESNILIAYSYLVKGDKYNKEEIFNKDFYYSINIEGSDLKKVCFNTAIPWFAYLEGINNKGRYFGVGLFIGMFFLGLTLLFDLIGNKQKIAGKYKKALLGSDDERLI